VEKVTKKHVGLRVRIEPVAPGAPAVCRVEGVGTGGRFRASFEGGGGIEQWVLRIDAWRVALVLPPA
jgi:hypothetical protein